MPHGPRVAPATLLLVVVVALAAVFLLGDHTPPGPRFGAAPTSWRGLVGSPRIPPLTAQPSVQQKVIVVLRATSLADKVGAAGGEVTSAQEQAWTRQARADQHRLLQQLSFRGALIQPIFRYVRVLNGVAAAVDPATLGVLEHAPEVAGIYPVRVAYPAAVGDATPVEGPDFAPGSGRRPEIALPDADGRGVQIALLDTGVDPTHPYLRGQVQPGIDVVGSDPRALAAPNPDDRTRVEEHGTELAGLLVGAGGPGGLAGVATGATILPIRVAGWQRDASGRWSVFATTDQLVQGLELAVDPNGDGDAHDAARVALVGVAEPFASFRDEPAARATEGALRLDTLVVSPAGNDGVAGPSFGSVAGPGGGPDGLSVGALDARPQTSSVRVVIREGLRTVVDDEAPLASLGGTKQVSFPLVAVAAPNAEGAATLDPLPVQAFFDRAGFSRAASRAVLVPALGNAPAVARNAALAGAGAVVVYGDALPAGGIALEAPSTVPVVSVSAATGKRLRAALRRHEKLAVVIGAAHTVPNPAYGHVAGFSSRGLALSRRLKPELVAPGVELATSEPGQDATGAPRYGTATGTSVSAALVAGAAALLAQSRPDLKATELRAALTQSAKAGPEPLLAQGTGNVDVEAADAVPGVALPATLDFGIARAKRGWHAARTLTVRNTTGSPLALFVALHQRGRAASLLVEPDTDTLKIDPHGSATLRLLMRVRPGATLAGRSAQGGVELQTTGGVRLQIPWTVTLPARPRLLLGPVTLSKKTVRPTSGSVAVLSVDVGRVFTGGGNRLLVVPAARLAIDLWKASTHERLGTLVLLRNVLPGRYSFGITGRSPAGADLEPGTYTLHVIARPIEGGRRSVRLVGFTVPEGGAAPALTPP